MNSAVKFVLYILFCVGAVFCAIRFLGHYKRLASGTEETKPSAATNGLPRTASITNSGTATQNVSSASVTNGSPGTNALTASSSTNGPAGPQEKAENPSDGFVPTALTENRPKKNQRYGALVGYTGGFFAMIIGLGLLIGHDVAQMAANRAMKVMYNDEGEGLKNPEYEMAEQVWADGRHLEAIGMMRDYLKKNPREQHVALRIAEIYEKDLGNPLAAALEYEEVLTKKLPPERWGWAAIHLCNLYFKLEQEGKAVAMLRRIDAEHGETAAAEKARKRLAQMEEAGTLPAEVTDAAVETPPEEPPAQKPGSKLPPGFGPKH